VDRRTFIGTLASGLLAAPLAAEAQSAGTIYRVGLLWPGASAPRPPRLEAFREGLRESGYVEGQNVAIEARSKPSARRIGCTRSCCARRWRRRIRRRPQSRRSWSTCWRDLSRTVTHDQHLEL